MAGMSSWVRRGFLVVVAAMAFSSRFAHAQTAPAATPPAQAAPAPESDPPAPPQAAPPPPQAAPAPPPQPAAPPPQGYPPGYGPPPGYAQPPPPAYGYPPPAYAYPPPAYAYPVPVPYPVMLTPAPRPPRTIRRDGLTFGGAIGPGAISADDCTTCGGGFSTDLHIGAMLHYRVALLADFHWVYREYDAGGFTGRQVTLNNLVIAGALQAWVLSRVWLRGGVGRGTIHHTNWQGADDSASAIAYVWGVGLELLQASTFAIDVQYVGAYGAYRGGGAANNSFLIGLNWY
jgi:hypothetical protein